MPAFPPRSAIAWRTALLAPALALAALLTACGGGGSDAPPAPQAASKALPAPGASPSPGLVAGPVTVVDSADCGARAVRALGPLTGGGQAVVWAARACGDPAPNWTLWVQARDAQDQPLGPPAALDIGSTVTDPQDIAAAVLPDGRVVTGWLETLPEGPLAEPVVHTVRTASYSLSGALLGGPRALDRLTTLRVNARADSLAGPLVAAAAADGSVLLAWRFAPGSYLGRKPMWRVQRLAADAEPLDWIQHLPRGEVPLAQAPRALRLTPLDEGGWIASVMNRDEAGRLYGDLTQIQVPRPLGLPLRGTLPAGAFVLDLVRRGSVLFGGTRDPESDAVLDPYSQRFDRLGLEQAPRPLLAIPDLAVALRGGDYVTLWAASPGLLLGQRFAPAGDPVGEPFVATIPEDAVAGAQAARTADGGLALAWIEGGPGGPRVLLQRWVPPATGAP